MGNGDWLDGKTCDVDSLGELHRCNAHGVGWHGSPRSKLCPAQAAYIRGKVDMQNELFRKMGLE